MTKNIIEAFDEGYTKRYQACKEELAQPTIRNNRTVQKPLSDEEIEYMWEILGDIHNFARAIEKHHGIGE